MNSRGASGGAPRSTQNSEKAAAIGVSTRSYSSQNGAHALVSPWAG